MEREKVKSILAFYRDIDGEVILAKRMLRDYEDTYYVGGNGGANLESYIKSRNKVSKPTEAAALNIPESASAVMRDLRADVERLAALKAAILQELNKLPLQQKSIVYDFYIQGLQWVQISARVHYSPTRCKTIRNSGLDNLARYFTKNDLIKNFNYPT